MKIQGDDVRNLINAERMARSHNLFFVRKSDIYLLYRRLPHQTRGDLVGRATTTGALLKLVQRATTST